MAEEPYWLDAAKKNVASYRKMIDATVEQLSDEELVRRPGEKLNSVAVILRHLGGNLQSRWTDFATTDGEKPWRDRDTEFEDWQGDRASLMDYFDQGWKRLTEALDSAERMPADTNILIRGEPHTLADAILRSLTHVSYHVGQISLTARLVHQGEWNWLTIAPGTSARHNQTTWGTSKSRSVFGRDDESDET